MRKMKTIFSTLAVALCASVAFADAPVLTEVQMTGANVKYNVPSHYEDKHNNVENMLVDTFTYDPYAYDAPTSLTPSPEMEQVDALESMYVPASGYDKNNSRWNAFIDGERINGDGDDQYLYDNFPNANKVIAEFTIPAGQSLKYLDLWGRAGSGGRNQNFVVELFNDAVSSTSKTFSCASNAAVYPDFIRLDLAEQGFTDNLLNFATGIKIYHTSRATFTNLAEMRMVSQPNPYAWTEKPAIVSDSTSTGTFDQATDLMVGFLGQSLATMYLVPSATTSDIVAIQAASVSKFSADSDTAYRVWTGEIEIGTYKWVALDLAGNLSDASADITFITDVNPPVVTFDGGTITETTWLSMSGSERCKAYLVKTTIAKTVTDIKLNAYKEMSLIDSPEERYMSTYNVGSGNYYVYAIDSSGNISDASAELVIEQMVPKTYENYTITNAIGGEPHYGVGEQLSEPRYLYNDQFTYSPNNPTITAPDQINTHPNDNPADTAGFFPKNYDSWWTIYVDVPADQKIDYIDMWGRVDGGGKYRHRNLIITLLDTVTGESWSSLPWSDMSLDDETPPSYGRYWFTTSDVQPAHLLYTANAVKVEQGSDGEFIAIFETRVGGAEWANTPPVPALVSGNPVICEEGQLITLDASASSDSDASQTLTYNWISPFITLSSTTVEAPTFTAPAFKESGSNDYTVMLQVSDGLTTVPLPITVTVAKEGTAIEENALVGFNVYPNPSNSIFNLDLTNASETSLVTVTDLAGKTIYTQQAMAGGIHTIAVSELSKGICILYVESGDKRMVNTLMVK